MNIYSLLAVAVGAFLTYAAQWTTERRVNKRVDLKAQAEAVGQQRATWRAFQVDTIADLQEQLEAIAAMVGVELAQQPTVFSRRSNKADDRAAVAPFGRAVMLTSRLDDQSLAADVRLWLRNTRQAMNPSTPQTEFDALRDRRNALQERLGAVLRSYHPDAP